MRMGRVLITLSPDGSEAHNIADPMYVPDHLGEERA